MMPSEAEVEAAAKALAHELEVSRDWIRAVKAALEAAERVRAQNPDMLGDAHDRLIHELYDKRSK